MESAPASGLQGGFLIISLETLAPFLAFCFLIKILAKSLSISMAATVSSRQYYPKHNLILNVEFRPKTAREQEVCVEQTGVLSKRPILASVIKTRAFGDLLLAPVGMMVIGREKSALCGECHCALFLNQGSGSEAENNRLGRMRK